MGYTDSTMANFDILPSNGIYEVAIMFTKHSTTYTSFQEEENIIIYCHKPIEGKSATIDRAISNWAERKKKGTTSDLSWSNSKNEYDSV